MELKQKERIRRVMLAHLVKKGWLKARNRDKIVFEELQNMYNLLRVLRLIPSYFRFELFKTAAINEFLKVADRRQKLRRVN